MPTNGRLDLGELAGVDHFRPLYRFVNADVGSNLLTREARDQLRLLQQAFEDAHGRPLYISEAYRSYNAQVDAKEREAAGGNLAAYPGTSNHGWAESCDFGSGVGTYGSVSKVWMDEHAPNYGWEPTGNSFRRREGWHFDYVGNPRITTASSGAVVIDTPAPESEEDDDMKHLILVNSKDPDDTSKPGTHWFVQNLADHTYYWVQNAAQVEWMKALGVQVKEKQSPAVFAGFRKI